jgi:sialic acid synthase SpsE
MDTIKIGSRLIGKNLPTYFVADIAANHDGDLSRAKELIWLAKEAGADAAKFQHFQAPTIVSDFGFRNLKGVNTHQSSWKKSVFQVYEDASINTDWTAILCEESKKAEIHFLSTPYDIELVDHVNDYVPAFKIGSGDITWTQMVEHIASKQKPYMLATGASNLTDVVRAVDVGLAINNQLVLMQCNTNYTASIHNFKYLNLNVLKTYKELYPNLILGLSDHTIGYASVLGAVAFGASVIEKHFTDDNNRLGPDHHFAMNPKNWKEMVENVRGLEVALGDGVKRVEKNEQDTFVVQRRSVCAASDLLAGTKLSQESVVFLRPCPAGALQPFEVENLIGKTLNKNKASGEAIFMGDFF